MPNRRPARTGGHTCSTRSGGLPVQAAACSTKYNLFTNVHLIYSERAACPYKRDDTDCTSNVRTFQVPNGCADATSMTTKNDGVGTSPFPGTSCEFGARLFRRSMSLKKFARSVRRRRTRSPISRRRRHKDNAPRVPASRRPM